MTPDESKGETIWHNIAIKAHMTAEEGGHGFLLRVMVGSMQRKMDEDSLTPVDIWLGPLTPSVRKLHEKDVPCMERVTKVLFKPGKSDKTFAEWLLGVKS